jgi:hypothetical protein
MLPSPFVTIAGHDMSPVPFRQTDKKALSLFPEMIAMFAVSGLLSPDEFKAHHVPFGVYEQRECHTDMDSMGFWNSWNSMDTHCSNKNRWLNPWTPIVQILFKYMDTHWLK